ncbi:hypothetical protein E4K64_20605 [Bradyrhizobium frederickii]|uniref:Uncharacterized protein n=1 Tax=Bradyrhizobium frederickii TaxID=2560054 RepID=A0A4Y9P0D9_9BRAD|nr:hypothetical protein [Bradyrhizobium frederickii]TFV73634.1 hypothetical protein E4K64_20605 [Bradyrhizobium frederickii]
MRDKLIIVSAAAERGRTAGLVIFAQGMDRAPKAIRRGPDAVDLRVLGGAKTCVFPDSAAHCLILLRERQGRAARVRL